MFTWVGVKLVSTAVSLEVLAEGWGRYSRPLFPVYRTTLPHKQVAWLVTRYEDVLGILKDERFVKDRLNALSSEENAKTPWVPDVFKPLTRNMLDVDEPDHTRLRAGA